MEKVKRSQGIFFVHRHDSVQIALSRPSPPLCGPPCLSAPVSDNRAARCCPGQQRHGHLRAPGAVEDPAEGRSEDKTRYVEALIRFLKGPRGSQALPGYKKTVHALEVE